MLGLRTRSNVRPEVHAEWLQARGLLSLAALVWSYFAQVAVYQLRYPGVLDDAVSLYALFKGSKWLGKVGDLPYYSELPGVNGNPRKQRAPGRPARPE